jgi:mono/diheme cytochrome c family protein
LIYDKPLRAQTCHFGSAEERTAMPTMRPRARTFLIALALVFACAFADASAQEGPELWQGGPPTSWNFKNLSPEQQQRMIRFSTFVDRRFPEEYAKVENDVGYTVNAIAAGGPLFLAHCSQCHGKSGLGNGDLASALSPSPALLAYMIQQPIAIDQYLLWTISEGGKPFGTAMPAFKNELSREEIWQVVAYLRAGFPAIDDAARQSETPAAKTDTPN